MKTMILVLCVMVSGCANMTPAGQQAFSQDVGRILQDYQEQVNRNRAAHAAAFPRTTTCRTNPNGYGGWRTVCD